MPRKQQHAMAKAAGAGLVLLLVASPVPLASAARLDEALQSPYQVAQTCTPGEYRSRLSRARAPALLPERTKARTITHQQGGFRGAQAES
jgi:hypothetical protein